MVACAYAEHFFVVRLIREVTTKLNFNGEKSKDEGGRKARQNFILSHRDIRDLHSTFGDSELV